MRVSNLSPRLLLLDVLEMLATRDMQLEEIERVLPRGARGIAAAVESLCGENLVSAVAHERGIAFWATPEGVAALAARGVVVSRAQDRVAVMFTDLVSSTALIDLLGEDSAHEARLRHLALLRGMVARHRGYEVKCLGDGLMVVFDDPNDALACAQNMQHAVARDRDGRQLRIGIDVGRPMRERGDFFGTPVIIAKRLCDAAEAGEILITDRLSGLVTDPIPGPIRPRRPLTLKGFTEPVLASAVRL